MNAVYARQSLDKKDSISIETQIDLCKQELGNVPIQIYIDKGFSGKNTNRPQFRKMMADITSGVIEKVVVYRLDRLGRSLLDFSEMMETFKKHNVEFLSTREKFDTSTPVGNAMLAIIMVFAQLERETIQERVQDNYYARSSRGGYDCVAPFGYKKCRRIISGKATSTLEIDDVTSQVLKEIFNTYAYTSTSLGFLAKNLNKQGVLSPKKTQWDSSKLSRIMANPVYVKADADVYQYYATTGISITNSVNDFIGANGCVTYGKWDHTRRKFDQLKNLTLSIGLHDGIVSSETFLRCQYKLNENEQISNLSRGKYSWLTGLIKCGYCDKAMKVSNGRSPNLNPKFVCSGATNYGTCSESNKTLVAEVEDAVGQEILTQVEKRRNLTAATISEEDIIDKKLKIEIAKIDSQINNLVDAVANGSEITNSYLNEKISKLSGTKNELVKERQKYLLSKTPEQSKRQFEDILTMWDDMSLEQKHDVACMLISEVKVLADETQISWKYNFDLSNPFHV